MMMVMMYHDSLPYRVGLITPIIFLEVCWRDHLKVYEEKT